jgi:hypothetical protein
MSGGLNPPNPPRYATVTDQGNCVIYVSHYVFEKSHLAYISMYGSQINGSNHSARNLIDELYTLSSKPVLMEGKTFAHNTVSKLLSPPVPMLELRMPSMNTRTLHHSISVDSNLDPTPSTKLNGFSFHKHHQRPEYICIELPIN